MIPGPMKPPRISSKIPQAVIDSAIKQKQQGLRDQFAMSALTGLLIARGGAFDDQHDGFARQAYSLADAMLGVRAK